MITCAIHIGSSRILAVGAIKDARNGKLSNVQIESEPAHDCISYGYVANVEQTAMHIRSILLKLGNRLRTNIGAAYLGIGGMSLHSLEQQPSVQLPEYDILASEAIGNNQYQLTIGLKFLRKRAMAAMERAGIEVIDVIALPQATACILTDSERERGCVLVDMGASTTTVSIYKDNDLRHLAVIPLGGETVTLDIQSAGCSYADAERIKAEWSNVAHETTADNQAGGLSATMFADSALPFPQSKLNCIALCRYEEIAANIQHQIDLSGLKDKLEAGCIVTGGAAMQNGLSSLLKRCLSVSRIETRAYREPAMLGSDRKPHLTNVLALLTFCTEDCQAKAKPAPEQRTSQNTTGTRSAVAPANDGQTTLDIPDAEPDPTTHPITESTTIRQTIGRFVKDLFTGQ